MIEDGGDGEEALEVDILGGVLSDYVGISVYHSCLNIMGTQILYKKEGSLT